MESSTVSAGAQARLQIRVTCIKPFTSPPGMTLSFTAEGASHRYALQLPLLASSFLTPVAIPAQQFMEKYNALGQEREQQEAFSCSRVDIGRARALLVDHLHMAPAPGVDTSDASVTTGAMFRTATPGPNGEPISVGVLLRLELNPGANAYRVTVRAVNGTVAQAMKDIVKERLLAQ